MLGKRPCLLRTTSSRSLLISCEDTEGEPATICDYTQVSEKSPHSAPCKIVIGFDIEVEKKGPSNACESPRSVLDTLALLPSQEKQHAVARSPRSGLGSLLAGKNDSGDGLEVVATQNQGKEMVDFEVGSLKTAFHLQNCSDENCPDKMDVSSKASHVHCKDTGWLGKTSDWDFMDADIPLWQRQAPCVPSVEDEHLDADIAPLQSGVMFPPSCHDMNANVTDMNISPYQIGAFDTCPSNGLKDGCSRIDADTFPQSSQAPWQIGRLHVTHSYVSKHEPKGEVSAWQNAISYGPGSVGAVDVCKNYHIPTLQSEAQSLYEVDGTDTHSTSWQRQALHQMSLDVESEEISIQRSIFSAASPPCPHSLITSFSGFLKECAFCGRSLRLGKDIYMYRGDQAFCSAECRYQKIVLDECKDSPGN